MKKLACITLILILALSSCADPSLRDLAGDALADGTESVVPSEADTTGWYTTGWDTTYIPEEDSAETEEIFPIEITDADTLRVYSEKSYVAKLVLAFLTADAEMMNEAYYKVPAEIVDGLKTVKFSDFRLVIPDEGSLNGGSEGTFFDFTVAESGFDTFPVGQYSYVVDQTAVKRWQNLNVPKIPEEELFPYDLIQDLASSLSKFTDIGVARGRDLLAIESELIWTALFEEKQTNENYSGGVTRETLSENMLALYGLENYVPTEGTYGTFPGDDRIYSLHFGGSAATNDIVEIRREEDRVVFVMQLYADDIQLVRSHKMELTFEKNDTKFGWTLLEIRCVEKSQYDPLCHGF